MCVRVMCMCVCMCVCVCVCVSACVVYPVHACARMCTMCVFVKEGGGVELYRERE